MLLASKYIIFRKNLRLMFKMKLFEIQSLGDMGVLT